MLVPQNNTAMYLGMVMGPAGVLMTESTERRLNEAKRMTGFLQARGFNGFGFRPLHSLCLFPIFIRSVLEYGLALQPLTHKEAEPLIKFQNYCLRVLFSVPKSTSIAALHLISSVSPIMARNAYLNASFLFRLHNFNNKNNLTLHTYRDALERQHRGIRSSHSLIHLSNSLNNNWALLPRRPLLLHPLRIRDVLPPALTSRSSPHKIPDAIVDQWHFEALSEMQVKSTSRIAQILPVPDNSNSRHPVIMSKLILPRHHQRAIILWLLGRICNHQDCQNCGTPKALSRDHGVTCSGITADLQASFSQDLTPSAAHLALGATVIDSAINNLNYTSTDSTHTLAVFTAINIIRNICGGYTELSDANSATLEEELSAILDNQPIHPATATTASNIISNNFNLTRHQQTT